LTEERGFVVVFVLCPNVEVVLRGLVRGFDLAENRVKTQSFVNRTVLVIESRLPVVTPLQNEIVEEKFSSSVLIVAGPIVE